MDTKKKEAWLRWYHKNKGKFNAYRREKYKSQPRVKHLIWVNMIKNTYGITETEFNALLSSQGGGCAICGKKTDERRLAVDHNHATGKVRGVLCRACNTAIGLFKEDIKALERAIKYLGA